MSREPLEDDIPSDSEEEFLETVSDDASNDDVTEVLEKMKPAQPVEGDHAHNPRRSVEDYLERKRLREELGSVFEEEDDLDLKPSDEEDD